LLLQTRADSHHQVIIAHEVLLFFPPDSLPSYLIVEAQIFRAFPSLFLYIVPSGVSLEFLPDCLKATAPFMFDIEVCGLFSVF